MVGDFTIEEAVAADAGADAGFVEEGVETSASTETAAPSVGDFDSTHFASAVLGPFAVGYDGSGGMGAGSIHAQNASNSQQQTQAQKDRSAAATAQMTTAMQAQQAAYQAAYNNEVSLNIGGEDVEIKQGDLHKGFKAQRQQLEQQIKQTRQAGGTPSAADLRLLERLQEVEEATDPGDGHKMDEEQRELVQSFADDYPDEMNHVLARRDASISSEFGNEIGARDTDIEGLDVPTEGFLSTVDLLRDAEDEQRLLGLTGEASQDVANISRDSARSVSASGSHFDDAPGLTAAFSQALSNGEPSDVTTAPDVSTPSSEDDVQLPPQTASVNIGFGNGFV
ncbi:MAG: hypothetical protein QF692_06750 [Alphaproteobacteria bacterium]|jgi:hypothetical protein|nr:hypothetical protein [Alphaproteobacteria bacterium]MDP7222945.1 hypothetical protein [Alphaproteobacteria bacterium]